MNRSTTNAGVLILVVASCAAIACGPRPVIAPAVRADPGPLYDVLLVGNSVEGSVTVIDGRTFNVTGTINVVPDMKERLKAIESPWAFWRGWIYRRIKKAQLIAVGEPHDGDRFVDDLFLSPDGTKLYVSRSNLGDVAAFDLLTPGFPMMWRTDVAGRKADHATISDDGTRIVVSASVVAKAQLIDTASGRIVGSFKTGVLPHQNDYSANGERIYNGSLGRLSLPFSRSRDKGERVLTIVNAKTLKEVERITFPGGVRPTIISDDETKIFAQVSYLNGVVKHDRTTGEWFTREQPLNESARNTYKSEDDFPHNSAHHGLAMSGDGKLLCDCATIEDRVWLVSTANALTVEAIVENIGEKPNSMPYWATTSVDGNHCFVSLSGEDAIAVIHFGKAAVIRRVPVGDFPQRNRIGKMSAQAIKHLAAKTP